MNPAWLSKQGNRDPDRPDFSSGRRGSAWPIPSLPGGNAFNIEAAEWGKFLRLPVSLTPRTVQNIAAEGT